MVTYTRFAVATVASLLTVACSTTIQAEPTPQQTTTASAEAPHSDQPQTDDTQNIVKHLGEPGGVLTDDGGTIIFQLSVDSVTRESSCTGRLGTENPQNGSFLFVTMSAELHPETSNHLPDSAETSVPLTPDSFRVLLADGTEFSPVATAEAWGCLEEDELLPLFLYPGESASGIVVLDAPIEAAAVIYDPYGTGGWSWTLE